MASLDDFGKIKRDPQPQSYELPSGATPPQIDSQRPEEKDTNNIPPNTDRLREIPQLVPLVSTTGLPYRTTYNVLFPPSTQPSQITPARILTKARQDLALKDTFAETDAISKRKAELNIFTPSGLRYMKANEGPLILNQPPRPNQIFQTANILTNVNNLSNAGTNYPSGVMN